ncbi:DUF6401 family natural product biosynthesis protein [Krasilnikovia sp. M28-CT-15]|uniref:DUF6401 family natural product biosynthesis protein n=1 Tax=Krasilnikovia sp. M28-CT-15 TaxID=3373540 RepID=UPI00399D0C0C
MTGLFGGAAARAAMRSAHACLDALASTVGVSGFAAAAESPGLLAAVDQHSAGIRESLSADTRPLTAVVLAAYAEGVREAAYKHGWAPPADEIDWDVQDWVLVRLLAVCTLARSLPARR